ncbi:hypothetical protein BTO06_01310 [Tenacibaculum sp. SZ-18]|uniref:hypothetical protein n=1 Tax=Tenacibaculum sp. SZ-18 TaxID=754423 RepID=UPI000C2D47FF|nr:hypothetical protein [Tenacibaculum sp. SZ-18]AUC13872.1 hypothetical protein BTO06_01310 [Tenacibaculum sp. SZ-18]
MKDRLLYGNTYGAVEHSFDSNGREEFHFLQLRKIKNELTVEDSKSFLSIEDVINYLKKIRQVHLVLVINNNQVLSKSIPIVETKKDLVFKSAYPTLVRNDFHAQVAYSKSTSFISIARNQYLNQVVQEYSSKEIDILDVFLGNLSLLNIGELIEDANIYTSNAKILIENTYIEEIDGRKFHKEVYNINGLKIQNSYLLSLAAIVGFYIKGNIHFSNEYFKRFKEKRKFNIGYKLALGIIFSLVLINFLYFNNYNKKVNDLQQELELKKDVKVKLKKISVTLGKKRKLLSELENSSLISVSKYTDQIVQNIPESVVLKEINYQPIKGTLRKGKEVVFKEGEIEVKGVLNNYDEFTSWIDSIEQKKWISQLLKLATEKEKRKKGSSFHILIQLK